MFGRKKESSFEDVLEAYNSLSDEDKAKLKASITEDEKVEEDAEVEEVEEKVEEAPAEEEKSEEVVEDSEEVEEAPTEEVAPMEEETEVEEEVEVEPKEDDKVDYGKITELIDGLTARMNAYDDKIAKLEELANTLENYNKEVEGRFGLASKFEEGEDIDERDMSYADYRKKYTGI